MNVSAHEWKFPERSLALPAGEVHVWRQSLQQPDSTVQRLLPILAEEERARTSRFYFERHARRFIVARAFLRAVLGRYVQLPPEEMRFCYGAFGKPGLAADHGSDLHFNLSHSGEGALLAVTRGIDIGIDLEEIRPLPTFEQLAQRFFAPGEAATLATVPPAQQLEAFFNCWTRKEAYIKACGEGLARPLDLFTVTLRPGDPARILEIEGSTLDGARWSLRPLWPWPGYVGCVALVGEGGRLRCWDGSSLPSLVGL